jgi:hypothetical protein
MYFIFTENYCMKNPNKIDLLLYLLFSASAFTASAQVNIENNTISNAGEYYSGSWGSLQVTIAGEPVIETIGGGNSFFTQGFEQPQLKGVGIISLPTNAPTINLYPNPASGEVNIAFNLPNSGKLAFRLFDMSGREIGGYAKETQSGQQTEVMNLDNVSQGLYMLNIIFDAADNTKSFSVVKRIEIIK